jgi:acyl-CoA thioesterase
MSLRIETGHPVTADVVKLDAQFVRFVTDNGRCMFEVHACRDGRSIEVRCVETTKVDGVIYNNLMAVEPDSSNGVTIRTRLY